MCTPAGAKALADIGAGADAILIEPMARPRDAHQLRSRAASGRGTEEPHGGPGQQGAGSLFNPSDGYSRGNPKGAGRIDLYSGVFLSNLAWATLTCCSSSSFESHWVEHIAVAPILTFPECGTSSPS